MLKLRDERAALTKVAEMLESGELIHIDNSSIGDTGAFFSMNIIAKVWSCGSVSCIGGSAYLYENPGEYEMAADFVASIKSHYQDDCSINNLFYPDSHCDWDFITPKQAAIAIRKYLAGSSTLWDHLNEG